MRCIELFAGAGGAALGLEAAGIEHAALCEWDPHACATLRAAGLGPVVEGDVRDLDAIAAVAGESCDLLWSSFPCQAFSAAGKRLGAEDPRNGWPWTVDALDRFEPRWFLGENVRGLLCHSSEGHPDPLKCPRCYFEGVIMRDLRARFAFAGWWLLDAADFGVPQHRRRVILWAGPVPLMPPAPTHADPATLSQGGLFGPRLLPWVSMGGALGLSGASVEAGYPDGRDVTGEPSPTVVGHWGKDGERSNQRVRVVAGHLARPSPTVSAVGEMKGSGPGGHPEKMQRASDALFLGTGRRRLTVEECAILQAFPDDHPWQGPKVARYRQVGNAVCPPMSEAVGRIVVAADHALN